MEPTYHVHVNHIKFTIFINWYSDSLKSNNSSCVKTTCSTFKPFLFRSIYLLIEFFRNQCLRCEILYQTCFFFDAIRRLPFRAWLWRLSTIWGDNSFTLSTFAVTNLARHLRTKAISFHMQQRLCGQSLTRINDSRSSSRFSYLSQPFSNIINCPRLLHSYSNRSPAKCVR